MTTDNEGSDLQQPDSGAAGSVAEGAQAQGATPESWLRTAIEGLQADMNNMRTDLNKMITRVDKLSGKIKKFKKGMNKLRKEHRGEMSHLRERMETQAIRIDAATHRGQSGGGIGMGLYSSLECNATAAPRDTMARSRNF